MTNPTEGRLLRSSPYQWRVARGLVAGVSPPCSPVAGMMPARPTRRSDHRQRPPRIVVQPCPAQHRELVEVLVADRASTINRPRGMKIVTVHDRANDVVNVQTYSVWPIGFLQLRLNRFVRTISVSPTPRPGVPRSTRVRLISRLVSRIFPGRGGGRGRAPAVDERRRGKNAAIPPCTPTDASLTPFAGRDSLTVHGHRKLEPEHGSFPTCAGEIHAAPVGLDDGASDREAEAGARIPLASASPRKNFANTRCWSSSAMPRPSSHADADDAVHLLSLDMDSSSIG